MLKPVIFALQLYDKEIIVHLGKVLKNIFRLEASNFNITTSITKHWFINNFPLVGSLTKIQPLRESLAKEKQ